MLADGKTVRRQLAVLATKQTSPISSALARPAHHKVATLHYRRVGDPLPWSCPNTYSRKGG